MKKRIIATALIIIMAFALSACGEKEPAAQTQEKPELTVTVPEGEIEPVEIEAEPTPVGIEPDSGLYTITSDVNGISFEYDSKYVAMQNPVGNIIVFAGESTELPYCTVSLIEEAEAQSYLNEMKAAAELELAESLEAEISGPVPANHISRSIYRMQYCYYSAELESDVDCVYIAEDLGDGNIVVYTYSALTGVTADVEDIINRAVDTFALVK